LPQWHSNSRARCGKTHRGSRLASSKKARRFSLLGFAVRLFSIMVLLWLAVSAAMVLALRWIAPPVTAFMLQQPGAVRDVEYEWTDRKRIAVDAARAVIAAEDQKFIDHHGLDFGSIDQALVEYRSGEGLRGASTITQQVAKNLFLWSGRSFVRKTLEAYFALLLETCLSKQRILELYLNIAEFGPGVFGVEAAAQRFFATPAAALSATEAALLAAVLPNPRNLHVDRPSDYVRTRQAWIIAQMSLLETRGHYRALAW
jgi:monofunctional biosynthetic peptidoglycan transglycosylase